MIGAVRRAERVVELGERQRHRVGTETALVGIELDGTEPTRVAQHEVAAVGEMDSEPVPLRDAPVARVHERISRLLVVDEHASAHPEMYTDADIGIARVEHDLLAAAASRGETVADQRMPQRGRGRSPFQEPGIGRVHLDDLTVEGPRLEHLARGFDFENLGHRART